MNSPELAALRRAHELFSGAAPAPELTGLATGSPRTPHGGVPAAYRQAAEHARVQLIAARRADEELAAVLRRAREDHAAARSRTAAVVAEATADPPVAEDNPLAQREAARRRIARLRAQRRHVLAARRRAHRHTAALRRLGYRTHRRRRGRAPRGRAAAAVRAALSRLGRPYVWGASGPDSFDCSGLTQWAYAQAGVGLHRTTYEQLHDGVAVSRAAVRPGDLVFPHPGHVQMAIGHGRVVEAAESGVPVRIAPLGAHVQIRRPT
ncbi:C40 family peptidase [Mycobacterium koreense]|uniref:Uncharacterized protein n=1 Tax=Mycolicibacillus koreensis TaxID=1069220 RepID=A0A7I7SH61_9MYCO|nr:C40 family peptidase [Mycolicibacillus koreensis]MCV7247139.1 C40 family peptidase [Mycolicibacillus koreensis]OSC29840.1 hypothetical protein B8W67_17090 [Mycolicibacillus koreensis]BBY55910.1 NLP/P60 family protein [Mycolicibacillus koreensis]